ncbi:MbcA/ParS/Xre antitoxin family protein [Pseudomonas taeanensis]|uniref:MbcA/ParS/Xre antitoxin family protein n=1 Tax=Pseudomonas taeanensis TaxID=574962 RepID=UPI001F3A0D03|nr:MbcA/ParS/Xre antitoxin family protein [Pseudomonas taeanensis]
MFGDKASTVYWLSKPLRALGDRSPRDVPVARWPEALTGIQRCDIKSPSGSGHNLTFH